MEDYDDYYIPQIMSQLVAVTNEYFVILEERPEKRKTSIYHIFSHKSRDEIGLIKWYGAWRKYCFFPNADTIWDNKCLSSINSFLEEINISKRKQKGEKDD